MKQFDSPKAKTFNLEPVLADDFKHSDADASGMEDENIGEEKLEDNDDVDKETISG